MDGFKREVERTLRECQATQELVAIHKWDDEPGIFIIGFVHEVTEELVHMRFVDTEGEEESENDPLPLGQIVRVHRGSAYLQGLRALYDNRGSVYRDEEGTKSGSRRTFPKLLAEAHERELPVRLILNDDDKFTGFVRSLGKGSVTLEAIVEGGEPDGLYLVRLADIKRVHLNTRREQAAAFLYGHGQGQLRESRII